MRIGAASGGSSHGVRVMTPHHPAERDPGSARPLRSARARVSLETARSPRLVVVIGASGGCGASTLVAAIAAAAVRWWPAVVAVDGQVGGAGLDVLFGVDHVGGVRWGALHDVVGPVAADALAQRLPLRDGVRVLSHGRDGGRAPSAAAVAGVMSGLIGAGGPDVVVVDLPRYAVALTDCGGWFPEVATSGEAEPRRAVTTTVVLYSDASVVGLAALAANAHAVKRTLTPRPVNCFVVLRADKVTTGLIQDIEDAVECPVVAVIGHDAVVHRDLSRGVSPGDRVELGSDGQRPPRGRRGWSSSRTALGSVAAAAARICAEIQDAARQEAS